MFGRSESMPISEFEALVARNQYRPNVRFIQTRWGPRNGAPKYTCTLVIGNADNGDCLNVPVPNIPEHTLVDEKTGRVVARGWRRLLQWLIEDRTIRPSRELFAVLGHRDFEQAKKGLGCV